MKQTAKELEKTTLSVVGKSIPRVDAPEKATGKAPYTDDLRFDGMVYARQVLAGAAHAEVLGLEMQEAVALPGVLAVITEKDIPGENQVGAVLKDQPLLAGEKVRYEGDVVALVVAESPEIAREASRRVRPQLKLLKPVLAMAEARAEGAPRIHAEGNRVCHHKIRKGDVDAGFREADVVMEERFSVAHQEHVYLEPQGAIAVPRPDGSMTVYGSMQCPFYVQDAVAGVLGIGMNRVRIVQAVTGGGFGGKEDVPSGICSRAAVAAHRVKRPVKLILDRREDMVTTSKRHPEEIRVKLGAARDGRRPVRSST